MNHRSSWSQAGDAVQVGLGNLDLRKALRPHMAKVHWAAVVGEQVAAVTQVESVRWVPERDCYTLVVRAKNGIWANELSLLKEDMVRRLNAKLGGRVFGDIRFKASGLSRPKPRPEEVRSVPTAADLEKVRLERQKQDDIDLKVSHIQDTQLRAMVKRSLEAASRTAQWKQAQGWTTCSVCSGYFPPDAMSDTPLLCKGCKSGKVPHAARRR